jgi:hypothetical protein
MSYGFAPLPLELAYAQDWSVPAIAAHLGCSVSTVKTRRRQARRCLAARPAYAERSLARQEREGHDPRAAATRSPCDEDHSFGVMAITSTFDGVATNEMTQG